MLELWRPFKRIVVAASLDGSGARGELQRKNLDWSRVLAIREQLQALPQVEFLISPTATVFNVVHLPEFYRAWMAQSWVGPFDLIPSLLRRPEYYDIAHLPEEIKAVAKEEIGAHLQDLESRNKGAPKADFALAQWGGILARIGQPADPKQQEAFRKRTGELDRLRGENTRDIFPEPEAFWDFKGEARTPST